MGKIQLFQERKIRSQWDAGKEEWFFSVVDVCGALSGSNQPRKYWSDLKVKLSKEGSELSEKIGQLKMQASDGKMRATDVLDTKGILRLIQSIPSKNAEPFKMWLAEVGSQRLDEMADPEKAILRGVGIWRNANQQISPLKPLAWLQKLCAKAGLPKVMGELSEEEFDILMETGLKQHEEGKSKSASEVREMFEREYGI